MDYQNHLLCELPEELRSDVVGRMQRVTLRPGDTLQAQGEPSRYGFFIESGVVALTRMLADGARVEAGLVGREGLVGAAAGPIPAFVEARVEIAGEAMRIEAADLQALMIREPALRDVLARYHQYQLDEAHQNAACNASHAIEQRLSKWLLRCLDRIDDPKVRVTQEFLAEMLGVQRTSVTVALQRLCARGLVATGRGTVELLDREGLELASCECYAQAAERLPELGLPQASDRTECPAA
jgi:CRP-like cAMP-binding protein